MQLLVKCLRYSDNRMTIDNKRDANMLPPVNAFLYATKLQIEGVMCQAPPTLFALCGDIMVAMFNVRWLHRITTILH